MLAGGSLPTQESKLKNQWPSNYDKDIRPVINASQPVRVVFGVAIGQIIEVVISRTSLIIRMEVIDIEFHFCRFHYDLNKSNILRGMFHIRF